MIRKIATILLSLLVVWYAAGQVRGEKTQEETADGVSVFKHSRTQQNAGSEIYGQIRATAALRSLSPENDVNVQFVLEGENGTYTQSVAVTPESRDENGLLSATAVFMDLNSGVYRLKVKKLHNAQLDYILVEDGDESRYRMDEDIVYFELTNSARFGSAWFMLKETEEGGRK